MSAAGGSRGHLIVTALLLTLSAPFAAAGPRFDRSVAVEILIGAQYTDERVRRQLGQEILATLGASQCYAEVHLIDRREEPEAPLTQDLLLQLSVDSVDFRTEYATSQAAQNDPNKFPEVKNQLVARAEVVYSLRLATADGAELRAKRQLQHVARYRPRHNEDPRAAARVDAMREVSSTARRFACKGSAKKLEQAIARAREGGTPAR